MRTSRVLIALISLSLVVAACSTKPSKKQAEETIPPAPSETEAATSEPTSGVSASPTVKGTKTTSPTSTAKATTAPTTAAPSLFTNERVGVTDSSITICSHIPITGAAPLDRTPSQLNIYWSWLNSQGGVNGRKVNSIVYDDRYTPDGAIAAVEKCKSKTFLLSGYAGVDQITAVASRARSYKIPYLHGPASAATIGSNPYQFFMAPDYEYQQQLMADYVVKVLGARKIAQVRLDSPHFAAGAKAFRDRLKSKYGITLVADVKVTGVAQKDAPYYPKLAEQLQGAQVINNFTNPNVWLTMIGNLKGLGLTTQKWVAVAPVASYNLIMDTIGELALEDRAYVFSVTPVYPSGSSEENNFKAAFAKYASPNLMPTDIDWAAWLFFKQLAGVLQGLGKDPTRSSLVAFLEKLKQTSSQSSPSCPLDFSRDPAAVNRRGAWAVNVFQSSPAPKWVQRKSCAGAF